MFSNVIYVIVEPFPLLTILTQKLNMLVSIHCLDLHTLTGVDGLMDDVMITHQLHKHCFWCKGLLVETNPFCLFFVSSDSVSGLFFPSFLYVVRSETPETLMWDYLSILFQLAKIVISSALNGLLTVVGNWMCRIEHMCRIHLRHRNNHVRLKFILLLAKLCLEFIVLGPNQVGAIQPSSLKFL